MGAVQDANKDLIRRWIGPAVLAGFAALDVYLLVRLQTVAR